MAVLAALLGGALPTSAQQAPTVLTLDDALRIARTANPEFLRSANDLDVAGSAVRSAWGGLLPNLNTNMSFGGSRSTTVIGEDPFGDPVAAPEPVTSKRSSSNQTVSTSMMLFDVDTKMCPRLPNAMPLPSTPRPMLWTCLAPITAVLGVSVVGTSAE